MLLLGDSPKIAHGIFRLMLFRSIGLWDGKISPLVTTQIHTSAPLISPPGINFIGILEADIYINTLAVLFFFFYLVTSLQKTEKQINLCNLLTLNQYYKLIDMKICLQT